MSSTSMSDVGSVGATTEELDTTSGAELCITVYGTFTPRRTVKVSPISSRSAKLKRKEGHWRRAKP